MRCVVILSHKYRTGVYQKAVDKFKKLESSSSLSQTDSGEENMRKKNVPKNLVQDYIVSNLSSDEELPTAPKIPRTEIIQRLTPLIPLENFTPSNTNRRVNTPISRCSTPITTINGQCQGCNKTEVLAEVIKNQEIMKNSINNLIHLQMNNGHYNNVLIGNTSTLKACITKEELGNFDSSLEEKDYMMKMVGVLHLIGVNMCSGKDKLCFSKLKNIIKLITVSVRKNAICTSATQQEIENSIKPWFRNAADRAGGRNKRTKKENNEVLNQ
ncbi:hypothetical protein RN001_002791 [Aquatica leii]|uniref:DUF4806 domain-containing protein n=1 Tax=Aquatica leii TaxID=1421715 RepID=A0AAN7QB93_9COLE|nr:hypothetical protein RN001_002791 [Aquatica leii]